MRDSNLYVPQQSLRNGYRLFFHVPLKKTREETTDETRIKPSTKLKSAI
jgi:hypothetical protein